MKAGKIFLDASLEPPVTGAEIVSFPFREKVTARNASFMGMFYFVNSSGVFPLDVMKEAFNANKIAKKVDAGQFLELLA